MGRFRHFCLTVNVLYHASSADPLFLDPLLAFASNTDSLSLAGSVLPGTREFGKMVNARVDLILRC